MRSPILRVVVAMGMGFVLAGGWSTPSVQASDRQTAPIPEELLTQMRQPKTGYPHLDTALNRVVQTWATDRSSVESLALTSGVRIEGNRAHVTVRCLDDASAFTAHSRVTDLGGTVTAAFGPALEAWMPIDQLGALSETGGISLVHRTLPPVPREEPTESDTRAGVYLTQGVAASNADDWHSVGMIGTGTAVAFIDSFKDYDLAQLNGELPAAQLFYYGTLNLGSRHGTACAEIIHDMAPGASITMASAFGYVEFAQKIVDLAALGHGVIASSQAPLETSPGNGTGVLADAIATARNTYGSVYVQSAGNQAKQHWEGVFYDPSGNGVHEFSIGDEFNELAYGPVPPPFGDPIPAEAPIQILLSWDAWPTTNQDFDVYLLGWNGSQWITVSSSTIRQTGTQPPWEELYFVAPVTTYYAIVIVRYSASTTPFFDLMVNTTPMPLEYVVSARSLDDIATSPYAISTAAVDWYSGVREDYSSQGPTYGPGGSPSGGWAQPRISGFANVDTWSTAPATFDGTSSASPHVAGAAALVRSVFPSATPTEVQSFLEGRAIDGGAAGYDYLYGAGVLNLGTPPCAYAIDPTAVTGGSVGGSGSVAVYATALCPWSAWSNAAWISITSATTGAGDGGITYSVAANPNPGQRVGTLTIAGETFTVTQDGVGCSFAIDPTSAAVDWQGGAGSVSVTALTGCSWTASSNASWLHVTGGSSGNGNGTVSYSVDPNSSLDARQGTVTIAGQTFTVNQSANPGEIFFDGFETGNLTGWSASVGGP